MNDTESQDLNAPELSIVVPLYKEKESVAILCRELEDALGPIGKTYEILLVDDGSPDGTAAVIAEQAEGWKEIRPIYLARNYGQTTALQAGFDHARGRIVVTLDGDLQNDPADIPLLLETLEKTRADLVSGWRKNRKDGKLRILFSRIANGLISRVTKVRLSDYGCTLKAYRRSMLSRIRVYGEMHRLIPALIAEVGGRIVEVEVNHRPRRFGRSKYGFDRTQRVLLDLLLVKFLYNYMQRPIQFFGFLGLTCLIPGFLISVYLTFVKLVLGQQIGDRPLLILGVFLMLTGILFITQGLIGEMISRVLYETSSRRQYQLKLDPLEYGQPPDPDREE